ncbi:unnamed protein product [Moneuplotes crassus]|uniref:Uncharacterized protein n=1 Tax=Euplotes crassus TaxID=5936 RepID=A0AAD1XMW6_EUPCR|nr:unnamed protein product [Moneuplotes crassus]
MDTSSRPAVTKQGIYFSSNTYLLIDTVFQAPAGKFSFQYWAFFFTYHGYTLLKGSINDAGTNELITLSGTGSGGVVTGRCFYKAKGLKYNSVRQGWNQVWMSSTTGYTKGKLYHNGFGEITASSYTISPSFTLESKLGFTSSSSNSYILQSFSYSDDDSFFTLSSSALYPNNLNTCGDGVLQPTNMEECDEGDAVNGGGCSEACMFETGSCSNNAVNCFETCGDGTKGTFEECDDSGEINGDGCDSSCKIEDYWSCVQPVVIQPAQCTENCGDGRRFNSLATYCDDNNTDDDDGCSSTCAIENGYSCTGGSSTQKDVCTPICGDGKVIVNEKCDDGNSDSGDGCSDSCEIEENWVCNGGNITSQSSCRLKCIIENCKTCDSEINTKCNTCVDGYSLNKDFSCRHVEVSESAQMMSSGATAATGIGSTIGILVSLMNLSAPMALWAMANQVQLMLLLLLTKSSLPSDIIGYITNNGFFSFNMGFLPIKSNMVSEIPLKWMDKAQNRIELEDIGLESGSTFNNNFGLVITICVLVLLNLCLCCSPNPDKYNEDDFKHKLAKFFKHVLAIFTFGIYIRLLLEAYQFILLSSISELCRINELPLHEIISGSFSILMILCCLLCLLLSFLQVWKEDQKDIHDELGEFTAGLKPTSPSRLYTPLLLLRRIFFSVLLIIFEEQGCIFLVSFMLLVQISYTCHLLYRRPMENMINNLVECINEVFFIFFVAFLLKHNSKNTWKGWPTSSYLWIMVTNSTIVVIIIFVGGIFDSVKKCFRSKKVKEIEQKEPQKSQRNQQRDLSRFTEKNINMSDITVNKTSSQVEIKRDQMRRASPKTITNREAQEIQKIKRKIVPLHEELKLPSSS